MSRRGWVCPGGNEYVHSGGVGISKGVGMSRGYPYHVTYPIMHVMLPTPSLPMDGHTPVKALSSRNYC